jgi:hypothetical protein
MRCPRPQKPPFQATAGGPCDTKCERSPPFVTLIASAPPTRMTLNASAPPVLGVVSGVFGLQTLKHTKAVAPPFGRDHSTTQPHTRPPEEGIPLQSSGVGVAPTPGDERKERASRASSRIRLPAASNRIPSAYAAGMRSHHVRPTFDPRSGQIPTGCPHFLRITGDVTPLPPLRDRPGIPRREAVPPALAPAEPPKAWVS